MAVKIMLDAGHYGKYNSGAIDGYYESEAMWTLHLLLKEELEKYGFVVHTTRGTQAKDLGVYERGLKAKEYDLFLSLHSNAIANESTKRVVIIPSLNGKGDALAEKLGKAVVNTMDLSAGKYWYYQVYKREYPEKPGVDYYGAVRGAVAAGAVGIIIEHSFHTNKEACRWLMSESNLKKLAVAEAKTVAEHYGVSKVETVKPTPSASKPSTDIDIGEGDLVKVSAGAKWMSGKAVPSFVINDKWYVKSVNGSRVVIDKNENGSNSVMSAIDSKYLTVVKSNKIRMGDKVKLDKDAVVYGTNRKFASFVYGSELYVRGVAGSRAVISTLQSGAVTGAVDIRYLNKI